jgi:hypothetical protein
LEFTTLLVIGTNCTGTNVVVNQIFNILQVVRGGRPGDNLQYSRRHSGINLLNTTLCDKVCQLLATGQWFSPGTPVSSTNKTDHHDLTEILFKVALSVVSRIAAIFL